MSSSNCCFLTCIQVSQEADWMVWYSHLFTCPELIHLITESMSSLNNLLLFPNLHSWKPLYCWVSLSLIFFFQVPHTDDTIFYLPFSGLLHYFIMPSSFICIVAKVRISFFFLVAELYSTVYTYYIFFIHSSISRHLDCFLIVNNAAKNTGVCAAISLRCCFHSLGCVRKWDCWIMVKVKFAHLCPILLTQIGRASCMERV